MQFSLHTAPEPSPVRAFRTHLRGLVRLLVAQLDDQSVCCGVTTAQCHTLVELGCVGEVSLGTLASRMGLDKSTLSRHVDSLVLAGWVQRCDDPQNRRQQILCLSPAGSEKLGGIHQLCDRFYQKVLDQIPPEKRDQVLESLQLLNQAFVEEKNG